MVFFRCTIMWMKLHLLVHVLFVLLVGRGHLLPTCLLPTATRSSTWSDQRIGHSVLLPNWIFNYAPCFYTLLKLLRSMYIDSWKGQVHLYCWLFPYGVSWINSACSWACSCSQQGNDKTMKCSYGFWSLFWIVFLSLLPVGFHNEPLSTIHLWILQGCSRESVTVCGLCFWKWNRSKNILKGSWVGGKNYLVVYG